MVPFDILADATVALLVLWVTLAVWIVTVRVRHDRLRRDRASDARLLADGADGSSWRRPRLLRVADGEAGPGAAAAARELFRRDARKLKRHARSGSIGRTHELRVLVRANAPGAFGVVRSAYRRSTPDVRAAIVAIAAEQESREADDLLLDILVDGSHPRSRTATELAPRAFRLVDRLLELSSHEEPDVRYWALMLLRATAADPRATAAAVAASRDPMGAVRAAAARLLGDSISRDVQPALRALLADDVFFVRAHAARAVGEIGARPLAANVASLLADESWWVRAAAKEGLLMLGRSGLSAASSMRTADDPFARDGAEEVVSAFRREATSLELVG